MEKVSIIRGLYSSLTKCHSGLTHLFGASLTGVAKLPAGAEAAAVTDRFAERPVTWPKKVLIVVAICFVYSLANPFQLAPVLSSEGRVILPRFDENAKADKAAAAAKAAAEAEAKKAVEAAPAK